MDLARRPNPDIVFLRTAMYFMTIWLLLLNMWWAQPTKKRRPNTETK
jgi:hypothetical protein